MEIDIQGLKAKLQAFDVTPNTVIAVLTTKELLKPELVQIFHEHWESDPRLKDIPLMILDDSFHFEFRESGDIVNKDYKETPED